MYLFVDSLNFFSFFLSILQIKGSFTGKRGQEKVNPYSKGGVCANCIFILCGPMPPSFIGLLRYTNGFQLINKHLFLDTMQTGEALLRPIIQ